MRKHRPTLFTRLLFFLLIFVPVGYGIFLAVNGENPIKKVREYLDRPGKVQDAADASNMTIRLQKTEIENLKRELELCREQHLAK